MAASQSAKARQKTKASEQQSELPLGSAAESELGPCPKCGKPEGKVHESSVGKFRHFVMCGNCTWAPPSARTRGIAVKLWNEAKRGASEQ